MSTSTVGIAGHGMLIAPVCPCRAVLVEDLLIIGRGYRGNLITEVVIKKGSAPATEAPTSADRVHYALGPGDRDDGAGADVAVARRKGGRRARRDELRAGQYVSWFVSYFLSTVSGCM